jgi:phage-related holin
MKETTFYAFGFCCMLILADYLFGILKAIAQKNLQSNIMRQGLWHKLTEIGAIVVSYIVAGESTYVGLPYQTHAIVIGVIGYISVMEVTSILENLGEINPALKSSRLLQYFHITNDENQTEEK